MADLPGGDPGNNPPGGDPGKFRQPKQLTGKLRLAAPRPQDQSAKKRQKLDADSPATYAPKPLTAKLRQAPPARPPEQKRQKLDAGATATSSSSAPSSSSTTFGPRNVGEECLGEVTKGFFLENKLSSRDIATMARGGRNSGASDVGDLAKAGAQGRHPQNAARDLMRKFLKDTIMPELFWHDVSLWNPESMSKDAASLPFILPHHVLASVGDQWNTLALDATRAP